VSKSIMRVLHSLGDVHLTSTGSVLPIVDMRSWKILMDILEVWETISELQCIASSR
jgi:hypothetical protein